MTDEMLHPYDIVILKSGGPEMKVYEIHYPAANSNKAIIVKCKWIADGKEHTHEFTRGQLVKLKREKDEHTGDEFMQGV